MLDTFRVTVHFKDGTKHSYYKCLHFTFQKRSIHLVKLTNKLDRFGEPQLVEHIDLNLCDVAKINI